jgi:hypothetical protein
VKKVAVLATLCILLFNTMGYFIVFKSMQLAVKHDIKRRIKENVPAAELTVIRISDSDKAMQGRIHWIEGKEFRLDGRMYDVVRSERRGDTTIYYCINDVQEETLFANLDKQVKEQNQNNPQSSQKRTNLLKILIHEALVTSKELKNFLIFLGEINTYQKPMLSEINTSPPAPPPKS